MIRVCLLLGLLIGTLTYGIAPVRIVLVMGQVDTANLNGVAFVDLTEIFGKYDRYQYDPEGHTLGWFIEDGKHPSPEAGKVIAQSIYDLL